MEEMQCPDSELLFKYADGEKIDEANKEEIERHLPECASCRKEYESYIAMRQLLTEYWDGKIEGCFESETLAEYLEGLVDDDVKKQIESHITHCDACASEIELMKQIATEPEQEIEIPKEVDDQIFTAIMAKREEFLESFPLFDLIKKNFIEAGKRFTS